MKGAREFYDLFKNNEQIGKLFFQKSKHARGKCFHIFVLPEGVSGYPTLPKEAVEVYGVIGGQPGWTEYYGWLHDGPWIRDFVNILDERRKIRDTKKKEQEERIVLAKAQEEERIKNLLSKY